ncbi:hypothetical protein DFR48_108124 [Ciceribacter lividus]|uniref:Uncharacterized protein n=1 Tax=Ciceribacter lividus TaxID=1197950 RepID=A0A6I7HL56_9HYPH|nr:hypothetical protein [Ciceribacter lividus]RCW22602.1 hypothetical protein DFR48_108124 [Ciceribacter lividus]
MSTCPGDSVYGASVHLAAALFGQLVFALVTMGLSTLARRFAGKLDGQRRVTFDNYRLLYHYAVAQSLLGLLPVHGFPWMIG